MTSLSDFPDLPERFLPPPGWRVAFFGNAAGQKLRYATLLPEHPRGHVVVLQGLSEFAEKYIEFARDCAARGLGFWIMDWRGQGGSGRLLNGNRRHAVPYDEDLSDLHQFMTGFVQPAAGKAPLIMMGHSMGGNLGLRYLEDRPGVFAAAAMTAPMAGIGALKAMAPWLRLAVVGALNRLLAERYIWGGSENGHNHRLDPARNIFSHDPERNRVQGAWGAAQPGLRVGSITYRWMYEALASCIKINEPGRIERIRVPVLIALAGDEHLVDNAAMRELAARLPDVRVLELPGAFHEIVMERDEFRGAFMAAFDALLAACGL